jgi:hypothetical protein
LAKKMAIPPLITPQPKSFWLTKISMDAKQAVELIDKPSKASFNELSEILNSHETTAKLFLFGLELQCVPHPDRGNYLWALCFTAFRRNKSFGRSIADRFISAGLALSPTSGHFQSLEHLRTSEQVPSFTDPKIAPLVNIPTGNLIDRFNTVQYDLGYRPIKKGYLSWVLQLSFQSSGKALRLDLDVRAICDTPDPNPILSMVYCSIGPFERLIPLRMGPSTTPRLYQAKHELVLREMERSNLEFENFVSIGVAGVMSNLPFGFSPGSPTSEQIPTKRTSNSSISEYGKGAQELRGETQAKSLESSTPTAPNNLELSRGTAKRLLAGRPERPPSIQSVRGTTDSLSQPQANAQIGKPQAPKTSAALVVGPARVVEFESAAKLSAQFEQVVCVNLEMNPPKHLANHPKLRFVEGSVQSQPTEHFDFVTEQFPQPHGRTLQAIKEAQARFSKVKPGGSLEVWTESPELLDLWEIEAKNSGFVKKSQSRVNTTLSNSPEYISSKRQTFDIVIWEKPEVKVSAPKPKK